MRAHESDAGPWRLPGVVLPEGEPRDLWVADGRITPAPVDGAASLPGRFVLPGLVDAHAHLAVTEAFGPGTVETATAALVRNRDQGVLLVRDVGAPGSVTLELRPAADLPVVQAAGRWHARRDRFFADLHDPVEPEDLLVAAAAELSRGAAWIKILADWRTPELTYDAALIGRLADLVHGSGARLAVHTQWPGVREVVAAGADSIEHGSRLDRETLEAMAVRGTAWTPTLHAFASPLPDDAPPDSQDRRAAVLDNYRRALPVAASLGVTILAGTDLAGTVVDEVRALIEYGLTPTQALRAATTDARAFLREPSIEDGSRADVVTFDDDPREDPSALGRPAAIILAGTRVA